MKENKLTELSLEFSVDIINLVKYLKSNHESVISNQIGRSGTSIGANIYEAQYAQGKKDFISKLESPLKKQVKRDIGWSCFSERNILMTKPLKYYHLNAHRFE